jgi:hypothetical protein
MLLVNAVEKALDASKKVKKGRCPEIEPSSAANLSP